MRLAFSAVDSEGKLVFQCCLCGDKWNPKDAEQGNMMILEHLDLLHDRKLMLSREERGKERKDKIPRWDYRGPAFGSVH